MPDPPAAPFRVLFVDDNPDDRVLAQVAIRGAFPELVAIEVTDAVSFESALAAGTFDVAITDYDLRWSNGLAILKAIKGRWPDRPVIMFTGSGSEEIAVEAMRAGLDDYVLKDRRRAVRLPAVIRTALARTRERRLAEDALRASEARKGAMLEAALDAVIAIDELGRITEFSPAAVRIFGHQRHDVLGRELADVVVPIDLRQRHRSGIARYIATGRSTILGHRVELRALTAAGAEIPVEVAINRIDVPGPPSFIGYVRDISDRRQLEESARQRQRIEAIGQVAGGVAHDFNNMLTVIGGFSELLLDDLDSSDPHRGLVDGIAEATGRAKALTRQLLAFSRRQVLRPQPVDLNHLVNEMLPLIRRVVPEDIVTTAHLAPGPVIAEIDPAQLEQVLLNLVVNARDAMLTGGTLTVETAAVEIDEAYSVGRPGVGHGRYAMIAVRDTGSGMSPEVQAQIFEPFFTTKEVGKGTGLGLAMAYGTVKQSGGDIWVYSEPGHGTTFRIHLPLSDAASVVTDAEPIAAVATLRPGTTVLIVEDEDQVRDLIVHALTNAGCMIFTAANGMDALATVDPSLPLDVVVSDVILPGRNGPELVRLLRETRPDLKAVFTSGYAPQFASSRGLPLDSGATFLQKPFTLNQLLAAVSEALTSSPVAS